MLLFFRRTGGRAGWREDEGGGQEGRRGEAREEYEAIREIRERERERMREESEKGRGGCDAIKAVGGREGRCILRPEVHRPCNPPSGFSLVTLSIPFPYPSADSRLTTCSWTRAGRPARPANWFQLFPDHVTCRGFYMDNWLLLLFRYPARFGERHAVPIPARGTPRLTPASRGAVPMLLLAADGISGVELLPIPSHSPRIRPNAAQLDSCCCVTPRASRAVWHRRK